ncbi:MAG: AAA family ATPase [Acidobacteriota bacterium]|nr:AAA family ATPase [Acidobacteriota bacterium]
MKPLPIGIQDFEVLRNDDYLYIDKTAHLIDLARGGYFFFPRPRRFGKSLLVSTLEAMFRGKKGLFTGLTLASSGYDFPEHPVIRLDFSTLAHGNPELLEKELSGELKRIAGEYGVTLRETALISGLRETIRELSKQNRVVVLVDEYDKPMLDHLEDPDLAEANRNKLREFYGVLKGLGKHIKMVFITGIIRFTKVSIFSELNNLLEMGSDPRHATLLGWTEAEIRDLFADYVTALADRLRIDVPSTLGILEKMYNGYCFTGDVKAGVYNPWPVLNAFHLGRIGNFWYESGSPAFLISELKKRQAAGDAFDSSRLSDFRVRADMLPAVDIRNADLETLLFQAGYLTIKKTTGPPMDTYYHLGFPNREVELSWLLDLANRNISDWVYETVS